MKGGTTAEEGGVAREGSQGRIADGGGTEAGTATKRNGQTEGGGSDGKEAQETRIPEGGYHLRRGNVVGTDEVGGRR